MRYTTDPLDPLATRGSSGAVLEAAAAPVWRLVANTLVDAGVDVVFGLLGSGNFHVATAMGEAGATFVSARHEGSAVAMADGFARASGRVGVCTVHQGPGMTNLMTGLVEAVKSRTPLLVLAADTPRDDRHSNFAIDQARLARVSGAIVECVRGAETAAQDALRALDRALAERRPVVLMLALDVQAQVGVAEGAARAPRPHEPAASPVAVEALVDFLVAAERPLIIGGRGAVLAGAGAALEVLAQRTGAVLASTAVAKGIFHSSPYDLGICGGFASPQAARRIAEADAVAVFGASLNRWTGGHGALLHEGTAIAQVDTDPTAIGAQLPTLLGIVSDCRWAAEAAAEAAARRGSRRPSWRTTALAREIASGRWRDQPFAPSSAPDRIDPRVLTVALDDMLPSERLIAVDSGHFVGWPSMYLEIDDPAAFIFPQAFQSVGLGLGATIGAALGRDDRLTIGLLGDGGTLMALGELETVARLGLPLLLVVYNDAAYGAEVHYYAEDGLPLDEFVRFGASDLAAVSRALGIEAITVRAVEDLEPLRTWLQARPGPLVIDAQIAADVRAAWHKGAHDAT